MGCTYVGFREREQNKDLPRSLPEQGGSMQQGGREDVSQGRQGSRTSSHEDVLFQPPATCVNHVVGRGPASYRRGQAASASAAVDSDARNGLLCGTLLHVLTSSPGDSHATDM